MNENGVALLGFVFLTGVVLTCFKYTRYLGVAAVLIAAGITSFYWWQARSWGAGYDRLHVGSTESDVVTIFGNPQRLTNSTAELPSGDVPASGCVKQYRYGDFLFPTVFDFCFDRNSRLLKKSYMTSY